MQIWRMQQRVITIMWVHDQKFSAVKHDTIAFWWCPLPFTRHKIQIFTTEAIQLLAQTNKYCTQKQWPKLWVLITVWCKQTGDHPHIFPSIRLCFCQHAISTNTFHLWIFTTVYTSVIRHTVTILCLWYAALSDTTEKTNYILTI